MKQFTVEAAQEAYKKWSKYTMKERMKPLLKLRLLLEENEDEMAYNLYHINRIFYHIIRKCIFICCELLVLNNYQRTW